MLKLPLRSAQHHAPAHRVGAAILLLIVLSMAGLLSASGCTAVGVIAAKTIPQNEKPRYVGLQKQTVAVMVWADRPVRTDFERIDLDIANSVQTLMKQSKAKELQGASFPVQPASIVRYQRDHPHLEMVPVTEFAADFGVSRLIYVELERFTTRSDFAYTMYRGTAVATLRVIEIENGQARVAYEENGITAGFPEKGRIEGEVTGTDAAFYSGTIRVLAQEIVNRMITHEVKS